jgi:HEAT repeat protein
MNHELLNLLASLRQASSLGDEATAEKAAQALVQLGSEAGLVAGQTLPFLSSRNETIRESLVSLLEDCGPVPSGDLSLVAKSLASSDELTAYWAATLLGRGGNEAAAHSTALVQVLADESRPHAVREQAAWALGKIGSLSPSAKETLTKAATSPLPRLARLAKQALE